MNKKVLGGCLAVGLLLLVVGGASVFWFVLRPLWQVGSAISESAQQWQQVAQLDQQVRNRAAFAPPQDGRLQAAQVERLVAVQGQIAERLGDRIEQLDAKYRELKARQAEDGREPGVQDMFVAYADLANLIVEAKRAQVEALNAQGLSLEEYRWLRGQAFLALGMASQQALPATQADSALAANAELLRPHRDLLVKTAATAWLGL